MAALLHYPLFRGWTDDGFPLAGGRLYTYVPGTSTPTPVYHDAPLTVPHTNPVILDAAGEALIYYGSALKVVLTDAQDVALWTVDPVLAPGGGSSTIVSPAGGLVAASGQAQLVLANALPAGVRIRGVTTRTLQALGTSQNLTSFAVGEVNVFDRWGTQTDLAVDATTDLVHFTLLDEPIFPTPQAVLITALGGHFDGIGRLEVTVYTETL
jgi:hypothetical protein